MKKNYKRSFLPTLKNLGKLALGAVLFVSMGNKLNAQVATNYLFSTSTTTYTPLTGGTVLGSSTNDDQSFNALPIGFTFAYNCADYTTFSVNSNGSLAMGASIVSSSTPISTGTTNNVISAFSRDLASNAAGQLSYLTEGTAPNRVLTVDWKSYRKYTFSGENTDNFNFQIKLYETSNTIEIIYGSMTNNATASTVQVGLRGASSANFNNRATTTDWAATTAGATNAASCTISASVLPISGRVFRWTGVPNNPPVPMQDPTTPDCAVGATINISGTPATDVTWYWQTSASGTSTTTPQVGATYTVFANGTYYLRAYNSVSMLWSCTSTSVAVTNFPVATAPLDPTADVNPSCVTTGTILTSQTPPAQTGYFWQGTTLNGTSSALPATSTYPVATTGTYYIAAYDSVSSCWSNTTAFSVTVNTYIPQAPELVDSIYFGCTGTTTQMIEALSPTSGIASLTSGDVNIAIPDNNATGIISILTTSGIPSGATVTNASVTLNITHTFDGDLDIFLTGPNGTQIELSTDNGGAGDNYVNCVLSTSAATSITTATAPMTGTFLPEGNVSLLSSLLNGNWTLKVADDSGGDFGTLINWSLDIAYSIPPANLDWYDAASSGNMIGTGSPFETISTSVLPDGNTSGIYSFYAQSQAGPCASTSRTLIKVSLSDVNVEITPTPVTCNNGNDGTFTVTNFECGTGPFNFSVNGGPFGLAPDTLEVGTYTVIVRDITNALSNPYTVTIGDALAPSGIIVNTFNNSDVQLSWDVNGSETAWHVEWGVPGFTPGTGTQVGMGQAMDTTFVATGLSGDTEYQFFVAANCGIGTTPGQWITINQTTTCDPIIAQGWCESFDSTSQTEQCWTVLNLIGAADAWNMDYTLNTFSGDQAAVLYTDGNGTSLTNNDDWLILPRMTLTANEIMNFHYRVQSAGEPNDFELLLSHGGPNPAEFLDTLMYLDSYSNTVYNDTSVNLTAFSGDVYIAFHVPAGGLDGWRLYIDQVCIDICTPDAGTAGSVDVCRLDGSLDLNTVITQGESNGVWSFAPNPGAVNGSILTTSAIPDGTFTAQYVVTTACVSDTTNATFTVFPASRAGTDGVLNVCRNQQLNLLSGLSGVIDLGGTWYGPNNAALPSGQINSGNLPGQFNYRYISGNGICANDTANITLNVSATCDALGLEEFVFEGITIYPNPNNGVFTISNATADQKYSYEVADLNGRIIKTAKEVNGLTTTEVDLSKIENGIYMVRIFNANGEKMERIVKQ